MTAADFIRESFVSVEVNEDFTEAVLSMQDGSRLCFRHRVGERWARAEAPGQTGSDTALAGRVLSLIALFRLNARHLDVQFADGTRWEVRFGGSGTS
jgi:hypothetical protein